MPSVTDLQQQLTLKNNGKSTSPTQQQQQINLASSTTDPNNADPIIQAILVLEKKQRNFGKRKVAFSRRKSLRFRLITFSSGET